MQGFNMGRYVPPELEGVASFNQASGKKPMNRKPDGSQVVRFECPFALWCTNCSPEVIIGQGVRFNAEKKKVGTYYTTPIWSFRIKHTICGEWIEIHTDPKNAEYVVVSGGRRRDTGVGLKGDWLKDSGEVEIDTGPRTIAEIDTIERAGAFAQLEKSNEDRVVADKNEARVDELRKRSERDWADPYAANKRIRQDFRIGRRQRQSDEKAGEVLQERYGLGMDLVTPSIQDAERAKLVDFEAKSICTPLSEAFVKSDATERKERNIIPLSGKSALASALQGNTRLHSDPFAAGTPVWRLPVPKQRQLGSEEIPSEHHPETKSTSGTLCSLVDYDSD